MPELSIVIPVFNNANSIGLLTQDIQDKLESTISYELILVNDGSIDNSWEVLRTLTQNYKGSSSFIAINLQKNYGQENAKMAGLQHTTGNFVVFMDADFQHKPEHLFELLSTCKKGFDVCYANFDNSSGSFFKRLGSSFYNYLAVKLLKKPKGIYLSSYNMFTKEVAEYVKNFASPLVNIDALVLKKTQNATQIFVSAGKSLNNRTNYSPVKMIGLFFKLLPGFSVMPLRILFILGLMISISGGALTILTLVYSIKSNPLPYLSFPNALLTFIAGLILFSIGMVGEYVGKIYIMLSGAEQYKIQTLQRSNAHDKK